MAEELGKLVVDIDTKLDGLIKGMRKADKLTDTTSKRISKAMVRAGKAIKGLGKAFANAGKKTAVFGLAVGAVALGGIVLIIKKSLAAIDKLGKMSRVLGLSTKELAAFEIAAEIGGVSLDTFAKAAKNVSKNVFDFVVKGTGEAVDAFKEMNITLGDLKPIMNDQTAVMTLLGDRFAEMENGAIKTALAVKLFGSRSADMLNVFEQGGGETLRQAAKDAELFGNALSDKAVRGVEEANDSMTRLSFLFKGMSDNITAALAPSITKLVDLFRNKLTESIKNSGGSVEVWATGVANRIIDMVKTILSAMNKLVQFSAGISKEAVRFFKGDVGEEIKTLEVFLIRLDARRRKAQALIAGPRPGLDKKIKEIEDKIDALRAKGNAISDIDFFSRDMESFFNGISSGLDTLRGALNKPDTKPLAGEPESPTAKRKEDIKETFADISTAGIKAGKSIKDSFDQLSLDVRRPIESIANSIESAFIGAANKIFSEIVGNILSNALKSSLANTIVGGFLGFAGGGRVNSPALVNERGGESLTQGKGLFIPLGGPATVSNAANTRSGGGGGVRLTQIFNIQTGLPDQIFAVVRNEAARGGAAAAKSVLGRAIGRA